MLRTIAVATLAASLAACSSKTPSVSAPECNGKTIVHNVPTDAHHTTSCGDPTCGNGLNPPTGGPHCPTPAACTVFSEPLNVCQWVHNLEHGHLVLLYNCPNGCPDIVDQLTAIRSQSSDPDHVVLTPWPPLQTKVAAVVWGWSWSGDSVDPDAIKCIFSHQGENAPEEGGECGPLDAGPLP
jgi:hypothetical protein